MKWTFLLFVLLAGCGSEQSGSDTAAQAVVTNHGYGYEHDVETQSGIRIRWNSLQVDPIVIDSAYLEAKACVQSALSEVTLNLTPPLVVFTDTLTNPEARAVAYVDTSTMIVKDEVFLNGFSNLLLIKDFKHEAVHILLRDFLNNDQQLSHASPLFEQCAPGIPQNRLNLPFVTVNTD